MTSEKMQHSMDEEAYAEDHPRRSVLKLREDPYLVRHKGLKKDKVIPLGYCYVPPAQVRKYEAMGYFQPKDTPADCELVLTKALHIRAEMVLLLVKKERQKEIQEMGVRWPKKIRGLEDPALSREILDAV